MNEWQQSLPKLGIMAVPHRTFDIFTQRPQISGWAGIDADILDDMPTADTFFTRRQGPLEPQVLAV